jgi:hypothetical protein
MLLCMFSFYLSKAHNVRIEYFSLPIGILLWNTSDLLAKIFEPFIRLFILVF